MEYWQRGHGHGHGHGWTTASSTDGRPNNVTRCHNEKNEVAADWSLLLNAGCFWCSTGTSPGDCALRRSVMASLLNNFCQHKNYLAMKQLWEAMLSLLALYLFVPCQLVYLGRYRRLKQRAASARLCRTALPGSCWQQRLRQLLRKSVWCSCLSLDWSSVRCWLCSRQRLRVTWRVPTATWSSRPLPNAVLSPVAAVAFAGSIRYHTSAHRPDIAVTIGSSLLQLLVVVPKAVRLGRCCQVLSYRR